VKNIKWEAKVSEDFEALSISELNKRAGRKKHAKKRQNKNKKKTIKNDKYKGFSAFDLSDLPKFLSYEDVIPAPIHQLNCGSCYIVSTMSMLEARLRLK
jgi:cathepsin C